MLILADSNGASAWVGIIIGMGGFGVGLWQYLVAQQWKRAEFVAGTMKDFFANPQVSTALLLLDYAQIKLNEKGEQCVGNEPGVVFDENLICSGLRLHTEFRNDDDFLSPPEMVVRMSFDELFTELENFQHFIDTDLVTLGDILPYLSYWLNVLSNPGTNWKGSQFYMSVSKFLHGYDYRGATALIESFQQAKLGAIVLPAAEGVKASPEIERAPRG